MEKNIDSELEEGADVQATPLTSVYGDPSVVSRAWRRTGALLPPHPSNLHLQTSVSSSVTCGAHADLRFPLDAKAFYTNPRCCNPVPDDDFSPLVRIILLNTGFRFR